MTDPPEATAEERLRRAVAERTADVHPDEAASLAAIERRLDGAERSGRRRRTGLVVLAAAAVVAGLLGAAALLPDDDGQQVTATSPGPTASSSTLPAPSTTVPDSMPAPPVVVWPPAAHAQFTDPVELVRAFVQKYLDMPDPPLSDARLDSGTGEVDVRLRGEDGEPRDLVVATVTVVRVGDTWQVAGAHSPDIVVEEPRSQTEASRPVVVAGRGRGYEGNLVIEAVAEGGSRRDALDQQIATAGCCEALLPFRVELDLGSAPAAAGAVVVSNDTGSFVVVPVRFAPAAEGLTVVTVGLLAPGGTVVTRPRQVRVAEGVLRGAVTQLLAGPTADERAEGYRSALDSKAIALPFDVSLRDGLAVVDFDAALPAASPSTSASAASQKFLAQLRATVFQFPTVSRAEYRVGGSCEAFWAWLQLDCTIVAR